MKLSLILKAGLVLGLSQSLLANDLDTLDTEFDSTRAKALETNNPSMVKSLRDKYRSIAATATGKDKIRAAARMGRLYIFEGDILTPRSTPAARKAVFDECIEAMDVIKPGNGVGENQPYYYLKISCLSFMAEVGSLKDKLAAKAYYGGSKDLFFKGVKQGTEYQGGGIYRSAAGVMSNPLARLVGLYKPEQAVAYANTALESDPHWLDTEELTGDLFCENYRYKLEALKVQGKTAEAMSTLQDALETFGIVFNGSGVEKIEFSPETLIPETKVCAQRLFNLRKKLR